MSYATMARMAQDADRRRRVAACAASEGLGSRGPGWADEHAWEMAAQPGWDAAYAYALAAGVESPGADESVITDGMILAAVQPMITPPG